MADVKKDRARKALVTDGLVHISGTWTNRETTGPAAIDAGAPVYCLVVTERFCAERKADEYTVQLSEEEMLATVTEWLKRHSALIRMRKSKQAAPA